MKAEIKLTAIFEEAEEGGYIAYVEELQGVNTQGETLDEARKNLVEALQMVPEVQRQETASHNTSKKLIREPLELAS